MRKRIYKMLVLIAGLAIGFTVVLVTFVYYHLFQKQMLEDLKSYALLLKEEKLTENAELLGAQLNEEGIRLTLVDREGQVTYDNQANISQLSNHSERPEIVEALTTGQGQAVRRSETFAQSTFYYAVRQDDGEIIRIARQAGNIYSIFGKALPSLLAVLCILTVLCLLIARLLTKRLIAPIEKLAANFEQNVNTTEYEELMPFVEMIKRQHQDIISTAKMRQEFTANVSHELKTPLTAISGYAELIETGMASEKDVVRFANGIHSSANRLLTLINDTIRLSELDSNSEEVLFERLNLYELARNCVEMLQFSAKKHNVTLRLSGGDCYISGNRQMLEELLYNLCDNAIRYNNINGSVQVKVYTKEEAAVLEVADTGIGIPIEHQQRIFERFYRVDKSRSKQTGGTGLGLAIVKHIVAKHSADLELESKEGQGTTIKVLFRVRKPEDGQ